MRDTSQIFDSTEAIFINETASTSLCWWSDNPKPEGLGYGNLSIHGWAVFVIPPTNWVIKPDEIEFQCQSCLKRNCKFRLAWGVNLV